MRAFFIVLVTCVFTVYGTCPIINSTYTACGYSGIPDPPNVFPSNTASACSKQCCIAFNQAKANCSSDGTLQLFESAHQLWQKVNCQNFICGDPCLDPLATALGSNSGALNQAYLSCGITTDPNNINGTQACTISCCSNMSNALVVCNGSISYRIFDVALTAFQLLNCPNAFTCYPNDKCFDPLGLINNGRGAVNRALGVCGIPSLSSITVSDFTPSTLVQNFNESCSNSCCTALENAEWFCQNQTSSSSEYQIVSLVFPAWQAGNCPSGFTCRPKECFDPYGLINSKIGAANRVLRACGALSDFADFLDLKNQFDPYRACHQTCCNEIEAARPFCNSSADASDFATFVDIIYAYQAAVCNATEPYGAPFLCRPNNQCWDILGLVNSKIGAANRAVAACGAPVSVDDSLAMLQNQLNFNLTLACTNSCCEAMAAALPFCNTSDSYSTLDTILTGYQLLKCPNSGFTCVPNNKCFDPEGLVNADRGYLNKAFKACGVPDIKTALFDPSLISSNLNLSCSVTCCLAVGNAEFYCNDSDSFQAFKDGLPLWQAKLCTNFQCQPESCFEAVGLINSNLGAANRVLRYCGAPSDVSDFSNIIFGHFDKSLACQNRCCEQISEARQYCQNYTAFPAFLEGLAAYQAYECNPTFLCQPNDQCFDPLGLINPNIGALNQALHTCGAPASIQGISDLSSVDFSNQSKICDQSCCTAMYNAQPYCNTSSGNSIAYRLLSQILYYYQSKECDSFTCNTDVGCYDSTGIINYKTSPLQNAIASCGFTGDLKDFSWDPTVTQLDPSKACTENCCNQVSSASSPCNGTYLFPLFVELLSFFQEHECSHFQCNITLGPPPFSLLGLSFVASVGVVSAIGIGALIIVILIICTACCCAKRKGKNDYPKSKQ